jgi:hypothetical protein
MPSIRSRSDNGLLFMDFRYLGKRCREQTLLPDTPANRKKLEKVLSRIESEIEASTFKYEVYFPKQQGVEAPAQSSACGSRTARAGRSTASPRCRRRGAHSACSRPLSTPGCKSAASNGGAATSDRCSPP